VIEKLAKTLYEVGMIKKLAKILYEVETWSSRLETSKHPWDWIMHFTGCLLLVITGLASWLGAALIAVYIEYVQKSQVWYNNLTWEVYLREHSIGDLIADALGIIAAIVLLWIF